jgi:hypothetical protein
MLAAMVSLLRTGERLVLAPDGGAHTLADDDPSGQAAAAAHFD